ncbi:MAG: relaxase MobL [Bacilli bacterium]
MKQTPPVIARIKYYTPESKHRSFYDCNSKSDYIGYIDRGMDPKKSSDYDYIRYVGNKDKSSGVFNQKGILSTEEKKELRTKLRTTKSTIWDMVISLETRFGKENMNSYEEASEMVRNVFPRFLKKSGFNPNNVTWFAGLHENTDNRHVHISFFENEPIYYSDRKKEYVYRKGRIDISHINELKLNVEGFFLLDHKELKDFRKKALEEEKATLASDDQLGFDMVLRRHLKPLYEELPLKGHLAYESKEMEPYREMVDNVTRLFLDYGKYSNEYKKIRDDIYERDKAIKRSCKEMGVSFYGRCYIDRFDEDIRRRMGNAVIKKVVEERGKGFEKYKAISNDKYRRRKELQEILRMLKKSLFISEGMSEDEKSFIEFERAMWKAETERLIEEGILDPETLKIKEDYEM